MNKYQYIPINCSKCGRFVGKDGFIDFCSDTNELGYPKCKKCINKQSEKKINE